MNQKPNGLTAAAACLIVLGSLNFVTALFYLLAGLSNIGGGQLSNSVDPGDTAGTIGYVIGSIFPIVCLVLSPATVMGGIQMARGRTRGFALFGAIVAMVPLSSCCFLAGIPVGIWALMVLRRPDVQAWFTRGSQPPGNGGVGYQQQYPQDPYQQQYPQDPHQQQQYPQDPYQQQYPQDPNQPWR
jgi:hypothetical protein